MYVLLLVTLKIDDDFLLVKAGKVDLLLRLGVGKYLSRGCDDELFTCYYRRVKLVGERALRHSGGSSLSRLRLYAIPDF